ncbi:hypothetical protein [Streptomyces mirabilis]|uniref:hypothetical protein n=1 Tax=Streptomyces mirabilis TaxID=68239 RepID=UPI0033AB4F1E
MRAEDLQNFRVKGVYSEGLVRSLNGYQHDPAAPRTLQNPWSREWAQNWADSWNHPRERVRIDGHSHPQISVPNPPPAELQVDGETLHLAHYGTRGAHYSRTPPPAEWTPEP